MSKRLDYNATLVERIDLTDKLAIFRIRPDADWGPSGDGLIPDFHGGQYVALGMNNERDLEKGGVQRPYSLASPPEQKDFLEFYIRYVDHPSSENPLTHLLWALRPGDRLHLGRKITGHFTLEHSLGHEDRRLKICVAAGTGLAPFISMFASHLHRGHLAEEFAILHGAREPGDLAYREELAQWFAARPAHYIPTISRPEGHHWTGNVGRVETLFEEDRLRELEARLQLPAGGLLPERATVFICGFYGTIHNVLLCLLRRGFVPSDRTIRKALGLEEAKPSLFFEQYDDTPILDTHNEEAMAQLRAGMPGGK